MLTVLDEMHSRLSQAPRRKDPCFLITFRSVTVQCGMNPTPSVARQQGIERRPKSFKSGGHSFRHGMRTQNGGNLEL